MDHRKYDAIVAYKEHGTIPIDTPSITNFQKLCAKCETGNPTAYGVLYYKLTKEVPSYIIKPGSEHKSIGEMEQDVNFTVEHKRISLL